MLKPSCHWPVSQAGGGLEHEPDPEQAVDHEGNDVHQVVVGPPRRNPTPPATARPKPGGGPSRSAGQPAHVAAALRSRTRADQDPRHIPATGLTCPAATTRGFAGRHRNRSGGILRSPVYRWRPPPRAGATAAFDPAARPRRASRTLARPPRVPQKAAPTADSPPRPNHRRRAPTTPAAASRARWPAHPRPGNDLPGRAESVRRRRARQGSFRRRAGRSAGWNRRTGCERGAQGAPGG